MERRDGLTAREPDPNRLSQRGVNQNEAGEPGRRGASQSYVGQQDWADHPSGEGRSGRRGLARGDAGKLKLP